MAESEFSWFKLASFLGALVLVVVCIVVLATGISMICEGTIMRGVACAVSAIINGGLAVFVYNNYQEKRRAEYED